MKWDLWEETVIIAQKVCAFALTQPTNSHLKRSTATTEGTEQEKWWLLACLVSLSSIKNGKFR